MKQRLLRLLEAALRVIGDRNGLFTWILQREPQRKRIAIETVPAFHAKLWFALKRAMVKVSSFDAPILRRVQFTRGGEPAFEVALDITDYTQFRYFQRFPDPPLRNLILQGGEAFVDIGANVGIFTALASTTFRRVYAFEPLPGVGELLSRNVRELRNVRVFPLALSNESGEALLRENAIGSGGSTLEAIDPAQARLTRKDNWRTFSVPKRRLDDVLREAAGDLAGLDLVKIDVEGHECEVIAGARALIERHRPILYVEIQDDARFRRICDVLPPGFRVFDPHRGAFSAARGAFDTVFVWERGLPVLGRAYRGVALS
jgi:FkbM family methyltransferase